NESRIAGSLVDGYNQGVRLAMKRRLSKGNNLFAMAASGTTDKPSENNQNQIEMGELSHGTMKLMMSDNSLIVPVAVWITPESDVLFEPCDIPRAIESEPEAHDVMR